MSICKKINLDIYLRPFTKINSKWIIDLSTEPKVIEPQEENIGGNLTEHDTESMVHKRRNVDGLQFIKIKNIWSVKDTLKRMKR